MAKEFGYCSSGCTRPQFEKQINNINSRYPYAIIIKEVYSSKVSDRTELNKLISLLERDDTLIINSLDKLGRDPEVVLSYYKTLAQRGVKLIFIQQPYMNTEVFASSFEDMISRTTDADKEIIRESLYRLLLEQIKRILEQSWEELQQHRGKMRESYEQARREAKEDGHQTAKKYESRKSFMVKELIRKYNQNYEGTMNDVQTMEQIRNDMGTLSRNTYYKYKKELAAG